MYVVPLEGAAVRWTGAAEDAASKFGAIVAGMGTTLVKVNFNGKPHFFMILIIPHVMRC